MSGNVSIHYETFGQAGNPALLLVNGLGSQLINYEPAFCNLFVDQGYQVLVYDNRDVGLSSKTEAPLPDVAAIMAKFRKSEPVEDVVYTLADMAADGMAVLDAVGVQAAHVAGMSMGGMIVQRMALDYPDRVLSMTSIMSTTGRPGVGGATPEATEVLFAVPPPGRDGFIEDAVESHRVIDGSYHSADYWRAHAGKIYDRNFHPAGPAFQIVAIASDGDRTEELATLEVPTLVIHGRLDPLIHLSGGEATAAAIPNAELLVIDEMGHDLPPEIWDEVSSAMVALAKRAAAA